MQQTRIAFSTYSTLASLLILTSRGASAQNDTTGFESPNYNIKGKFLLCIIFILGALSPASAQWSFANFSTWTAGTTSQSVTRPGFGTVAVSGMTSFASGFPLYYAETYSNPSAPITGIVPELWVREVAGTTATIRFDFSVPLDNSSYIILDDVDLNETMTLKAYDSGGTLLPLSAWIFSKFDIHPPTDNVGPTWTVDNATNIGTMTSDGVSTDQWAAFIKPALGQSISRIDATVAQQNGGFEFAFAQAIPEPSSLALLGLAGCVGMYCLRQRAH
jgi:hypothetical protein